MAAAGTVEEIQSLRRGFLQPPDDARILMRWWWFGPSVEKRELERELRVMKAAGIGGVEIQPVYPLELDNPQTGFRNFGYLTDEFLDALRFVSETAKRAGMRVDITLGSGWPYGGPHTPVSRAAGRLRVERIVIPPNTESVAVPAIEAGEGLIAAFLQSEKGKSLNDGFQQLDSPREGRIALTGGANGERAVLFFIASRTGQQVKRAGIGAEGFVLDHYDAAAIQEHLKIVGDRLMQGFGSNPPYAVFSDSLEVFESDWTPDFLQQFQKRRGYDLQPLLPMLFGEMGEPTRSVRHDWAKTLTELAEERYLTPIREWAHAHNTRFRSQTYGEPPVILSSNALVDLPEGEHGPEWRGFSAARWASSASHLYGRPVTSSETWTWLHAPSFRATPLDMKAEADRHFLEGINQVIGHGWPYSPPSASEPGWRFYASAALNEHNPWFPVMPQITQYLQRISWLMRQGRPANDVCIYLPTDDAWARLKPGKVSVDQGMESILGPDLIPQVLDSGFNFDFVDDRAIEAVGLPNRILILPGVERVPLATLRKIESFLQRGGIVIATKRLPSRAPGRKEAKTQTATIKESARSIFSAGRQNSRLVSDERTLGRTLTAMLTPDFATAPGIGFIHRKLPDAEIYFLANTTNQPINTSAAVRVEGMEPQWWDPFNGMPSNAPVKAIRHGSQISFKLAPYESRVLVFSHVRESAATEATHIEELIDLSTDWKVKFPGTGRRVEMPQLESWTDHPETRYYSGTAEYAKTVQVPASWQRNSSKIVLSFGFGQPIPELNPTGLGMQALLESPVREAALVYVNRRSAGFVWHPPYEVDVTKLIQAGTNEMLVAVSNLAINELAGKSLPDYRLLSLRYGERFTPQGFEHLTPLPSGILGTVQMILRK